MRNTLWGTRQTRWTRTIAVVAALGLVWLPGIEPVDAGIAPDIVVLGGPSAVSDAVVSRLATCTSGLTSRIAGANRYATAAAVSAAYFDPPLAVAYVATGENFPDALAGSAAAGAGAGGPILLVRPTSVPAETSAELARLKPAVIVVLGGTAAVSAGVEATLGGYGTVVRVAGTDRYTTAAAVSTYAFPTAETAYVATATNFPDALAGGPAAIAAKGPVMLVEQNNIPASVKTELTRLGVSSIKVLGGSAAVSAAVETELATYAATVTRLSGPDRYATAAAVSRDTFATGVGTIFVATGENFPDALAGGPVAGARSGPILLVAKDSLPGPTEIEIERLTGGTCGPATSVPAIFQWSRVANDEAVFRGSGWASMESVVAGGPGLVAVGRDWDGIESHGAAWWSVDGLKWNRVADDEAVFGGPGNQTMRSVVAGGPGFVAVGRDNAAGDLGAAAVWWSVDGKTWNRVPHNETVFGGAKQQAMRSIAVGGPGLVAVGDDSSGGETNAAVWWSVDGKAWNRVAKNETVFGGPGYQVMRSVTAGGPGLVAVGYDRWDTNNKGATVWWSTDGKTWNRVPRNESVFGGVDWQTMYSVAPGGPGLVAVGIDSSKGDSGAAAVWWSVDGKTWSRVPHNENLFGGRGSQTMNSVAPGGPGLVAVGWDQRNGDTNAAVWRSVDGMTWDRVPHNDAVFGGPDRQDMLSVVAGGPGLVAIGREWIGPDAGRIAVWVAAP